VDVLWPKAEVGGRVLVWRLVLFSIQILIRFRTHRVHNNYVLMHSDFVGENWRSGIMHSLLKEFESVRTSAAIATMQVSMVSVPLMSSRYVDASVSARI
jgi:hypothetical protein